MIIVLFEHLLKYSNNLNIGNQIKIIYIYTFQVYSSIYTLQLHKDSFNIALYIRHILLNIFLKINQYWKNNV